MMKFDLSNEIEKQKATTRFNSLIEKGKKIELKEVREVKSLNQNAYLHKILSLFAIETGATLEEMKTDMKRECAWMKYEKNGKYYLRKTSTLDSKEMTDFIEFVRNFSSKQGYYLPTPDEYLLNQFNIDQEIDKHKNYL